MDKTFQGPWKDSLQTDPLRILVNRLRSSANDGNTHLYEVANCLAKLLNDRDYRLATTGNI